MHSLLRVLIAGTVINFITVPFLFGQSNNENEFQFQKLSLKENHNSLSVFEFSQKIKWNSELSGALLQDSVKPKDSTFTTKPVQMKKFHMKKNPLVAVLLSAALPGAGQFYNQSYWKIPIIDGFVGYFVYEYIREDKNFRDYRDQYAASQTPQFPEGDDNLKTLREFYRSQRNNFTWYFLIVYFINLVDAYVDAHLFDFTVKDDKLATGLIDRKMNLNIHIPIR
jgi:hypothetical protein